MCTRLQQHGQEGLDLQDLRALLQQQVVVLEGQLQEVAPLEGGVRAGHGHHLGLPRHQVVHPVLLALRSIGMRLRRC